MPGGGRVRTYSNRKKGQPAKGKTKPVVTESTSSQIQGSGFKSKDDANDMDHSPQKTKPADELVAILDNMPGVDILANIQKVTHRVKHKNNAPSGHSNCINVDFGMQRCINHLSTSRILFKAKSTI